jgi:predicted nucleotide-binding protein (sugar kinase/HSP70/actin superfamily)
MNQIFIGIILVLGLGGYWLYQENITLKANNSVLETAVEEQKATIVAIKENFEKQGKALQQQQRVNAQIEAEKQEYLQIFARHNLSSLALARPGMIETRVNNETDAVFEGIEDDTQAIFELDTINIPD